jgi:hypothetical protein
MHVANVVGGTQRVPLHIEKIEVRRNDHGVMLAADGVAHSDHFPLRVFDEDKTMAAVEHGTKVVVVAIASKVESLRRYLVRRVADGIELDTLVPLALEEDAREVHFLVVCIEIRLFRA